MEKEVVEQYLKTIQSLSEKGKPVKTTEIAKAMGIAPATVTESLQKMAKKRLIKYEPYHGASLTSKGEAIARKVSRKHRLLERFLSDVLGIEKSKVHEQACQMEHTLSDEAEVALCRMLNHPETCPDDKKTIPPCGLDVESCIECKSVPASDIKKIDKEEKLRQLTELKKGDRAKVQFIRGGRGVVESLHKIGLTKGAEVEVVNMAPFSGPIEICARGCRMAIGRGVASKIFVQK